MRSPERSMSQIRMWLTSLRFAVHQNLHTINLFGCGIYPPIKPTGSELIMWLALLNLCSALNSICKKSNVIRPSVTSTLTTRTIHKDLWHILECGCQSLSGRYSISNCEWNKSKLTWSSLTPTLAYEQSRNNYGIYQTVNGNSSVIHCVQMYKDKFVFMWPWFTSILRAYEETRKIRGTD